MSKPLKKLQGDNLYEFLYDSVYGHEYEEGKRINWTMQNSLDLVHDLALDGWEADPEEILEAIQAWDKEDGEMEAAEQL